MAAGIIEQSKQDLLEVWVIEFIDWVIEFIEKLLNWVIEFIKKLLNWVIRFMKKLLNWVIRFMKKLLIICFILFSYFYFTFLRYEKDRYDDRYYPVSLNEKWTKTIEYKTLPNVKFPKCFSLEVNSEQMMKKIGESNYYDIYSYKYSAMRTWDLSNREFSLDIKEKPHFLLQIYKDNTLIRNEIIYIFSFNSSYVGNIEGKEIYLKEILGVTQSRENACYDFDESTHYTIILTNQYPTIEFQNVETYLAIKPVFSGK